MERPTPTAEVPETTGPAATGTVHVHYWAAAKAAAGVAGDELQVDGPLTLAEVVRRVLALHSGSKLPQVLAICSALVGDRPVGASDPAEVTVEPGQTVEFLPPFAGG
ncbi:MoaD/ThiS family protein [Nocardioides panaciterrulae]|uniref:Molybdopterin converting factor small subunit n=1 Tax=Nocardioides panaciterrulae TaxID=661492 RepID=A0A7Y9E3P2_9ACTN|nr:MoaD/ThiS family protein [Nocardioides panaciterrulae]NYD40452.1 molybdopterin converting factor small subunit [Nocardioides panaciterrulae]